MTITLEAIKAALSLNAGEHYAGLVLDTDGNATHHLVLLPGEGTDLTWNKAGNWAREAGGELPTRQEQALLYANLKAHFQPTWYWSSEVHESSGSFAWSQYFPYGFQYNLHKSYKGRARAVRRITA